MALDNLISITFSEEELTSLQAHIQGIRQIISSKTVNLTAEERRQYGRIANQNKLLVDKTKDYMEQHPHWVPGFLDKEEFDRDYVARQQTENVLQQLENLTQQFVDTKTLLDHDNYNNALTFYRYVRYLSSENEPGANQVYNDMKTFFTSRQSSNAGAEATDETSEMDTTGSAAV